MAMGNVKVQSVIESAFLSAINKLEASKGGNCYSDIYVQVDAETGELQIYDEEDRLIEKTVIFDWVNVSCEDEQFVSQVAAELKSALAALAAKQVFEKPCFLKPFSVSLTDEDFSTLEELLFIDDENLRLDDPLLKNLDAELDDFLAKLLSDVK